MIRSSESQEIAIYEAGELRALFRRKMREWGYYDEQDVEEFLLEAHRMAQHEAHVDATDSDGMFPRNSLL